MADKIPPLTILIMNVHGNPTATRRRQAISRVIDDTRPDVVLFQQFRWAGIRRLYRLSPSYQYKRHENASLMYDSDTVSVDDDDFLQLVIDEILAMQNIFYPVPRMCFTKVMPDTNPVYEFICISWHGWYNGTKENERINLFMLFMEFLTNFQAFYDLPMLIAGSFNIKREEIENLVLPPFHLCGYNASERRIDNVTDFYIISEELHLEGIRPVVLEEDEEEVLDHDPIIATLRPRM
ncbi:uncharacterized protein LOC128207984 [Mya arenaria]|uniref:uncharacterized protein LOC128207984 n=1 Tax=Mya arenaria TaxID=6604 RepID=UPI0022E2F590|nr:uncharacterized protein LOC128207984 [Mya arenaria]